MKATTIRNGSNTIDAAEVMCSASQSDFLLLGSVLLIQTMLTWTVGISQGSTASPRWSEGPVLEWAWSPGHQPAQSSREDTLRVRQKPVPSPASVKVCHAVKCWFTPASSSASPLFSEAVRWQEWQKPVSFHCRSPATTMVINPCWCHNWLYHYAINAFLHY